MSETEDRPYRVTWRTVGLGTGSGERLEVREFTAAYWKRDGELIVFKRTDGAAVFTVAEEFLETIESVGELAAA